MPPMSPVKQDLLDTSWERMPYVRRNIIGRRIADKVTDICIATSPLEFMTQIEPGSPEEKVIRKAWAIEAKRRYCCLHGEDVIAFGPLFWIIVSPLIQVVIARIIEWWLESNSHKALLKAWR